MRIGNWGMFILGIYLIVVGLISFGILASLERVAGILALVAGILILMEHWKR